MSRVVVIFRLKFIISSPLVTKRISYLWNYVPSIIFKKFPISRLPGTFYLKIVPLNYPTSFSKWSWHSGPRPCIQKLRQAYIYTSCFAICPLCIIISSHKLQRHLGAHVNAEWTDFWTEVNFWRSAIPWRLADWLSARTPLDQWAGLLHLVCTRQRSSNLRDCC